MTLSERIYGAISNAGPRTNNARALADEVAALEARLSEMEENIRPIIESDYTGQGSAQDYDAVLEMIQEELAEALAGGER